MHASRRIVAEASRTSAEGREGRAIPQAVWGGRRSAYERRRKAQESRQRKDEDKETKEMSGVGVDLRKKKTVPAWLVYAFDVSLLAGMPLQGFIHSSPLLFSLGAVLPLSDCLFFFSFSARASRGGSSSFFHPSPSFLELFATLNMYVGSKNSRTGIDHSNSKSQK